MEHKGKALFYGTVFVPLHMVWLIIVSFRNYCLLIDHISFDSPLANNMHHQVKALKIELENGVFSGGMCKANV